MKESSELCEDEVKKTLHSGPHLRLALYFCTLAIFSFFLQPGQFQFGTIPFLAPPSGFIAQALHFYGKSPGKLSQTLHLGEQ